jgi:UDP-3-O-[3-hydroxymyristoyl] glucosamine N-acyltransferase
VGHNVRIGAHTAIAACSGIAGSANIGAHCMIYGNVQINGHIKIVDHVVISACTAVSNSILKPGTYSGVYPYDEHGAWLKNAAVVRQLARLLDRVRALEAKEKKNG